ncbi:MAG: glycosyl transferase group 1 [Brevundimonas sp.]|nr:glycosyl transferase group 1 [Brevundimonas sp.]
MNTPAPAPSSVDNHPWDHPYLTSANIERFRAYSDQVIDFALDYASSRPDPLSCGFSVNMAQNMYKWAVMATQQGWNAALVPNPMDRAAISQPEWEEFDGEFDDLLAGDEFLSRHPGIPLRAPVRHVPMDGSDFFIASQMFEAGDRKPLLALLAEAPSVRDEDLMKYVGAYPYYAWAKALSEYDVNYACSSPLAAYFSGAPYCVCSVGGDFQFDAGRADDLGKLMIRSFNGARFQMMSNPHSLGHSRRLGLSNAVYLPYPMDTDRYSPGVGLARARWNAEFGDGVYVLTTARLDGGVKGHDSAFFDMIVRACQTYPTLRFVFLRWGAQAEQFGRRIAEAGLQDRLLMMPPVGKARLIDYYRSCDVVLDQFVYGYYGATGLEAAAVGKPLIIKLRDTQYRALYAGDTCPAFNVSTPDEVFQALGQLAENPQLRQTAGAAMRAWMLRNHAEERTAPMLMALLRLAAGRVKTPADLRSPLLEPETEEEAAYHAACLVSPP